MAAVDDPKTYGRARLGFASEADIDEFADMLGRFERGEIGPDAVARVPAGARHLRAAAGRGRADAAGQDPAGHPDRRAARGAGRRRRSVFPRLRAHHDAAERAVPLHAAARRRAGDAAAGRRRADDARGVRQLGAQHHGLPVGRGVGRRGLRRHAVRRGADAAPAAASAQLDPAAQVQDRLRRMCRGSHEDRHQRPRLPRRHLRKTARVASV